MFAASKSGKFTAGVAPTTDPSFAYVPLLLETTGTNGQQNNTFLDSSTNNFTITRNGTPTQGSCTPYWPNGQWSNYFNGSSTLNLATNAIPASGAFTFETFVYVTGTAASQVIAAQYPNGTASGRLMILWNDTANKFTVVLGASTVFVSDATYSANSWLYLVVQRDASNVWSMYVNGTRNTATVSSATAIDTAVTYIGNRNTGGTPYTGYISNLRVVSSALYSGSTISVPTTPFSVSTANQTLLTCYSNRFIDANTATAAKTITVTGSPSVQAFQPFAPAASYSAATYAGSGYFNGSTDYLSNSTNNTALALGSGDFTFEFWMNAPSGASSVVVYDNRITTLSSAGGFQIYHQSGTIYAYGGAATGTLLVSASITYNAWTHIAVVRNGSGTGNVKLYVNGVLASTYGSADTNNYAQGYLNIGTFLLGGTPSGFYSGYLSNVRLVKGVAIYTTAFTPPTTPVTNTAQTSLLLNMANAGIYDAAAQNDITTVGDAQVSTAQSKWSPSSMRFDGTGDYLTIPTNTALVLGTANFTIEGWVYFNTVAGAQTIWDQRPAATNGAYPVIYMNGAIMTWYVNSAAQITSGSLTTGVWYYFAVTRVSSVTKMFINGSQVGSNYTDTNTYLAGQNLIGVANTSAAFLNGYLQDFRITRGVARTVTTPTAAFPTR